MTAEKRVLPPSFKMMLDERVKESFATAKYEIVDWTQVLHAGWEGDSMAVLVRLPDGSKEIVFADASGVAQVDLEERVSAYEAAIANTKAFLEKMREA